VKKKTTNNKWIKECNTRRWIKREVESSRTENRINGKEIVKK
jgi:hypothetical protein